MSLNNSNKNILDTDLDMTSLDTPKWLQVFNKIAICLGIINLGASILSIFSIPYLLSLLFLAPTLGPISYIVVKKLKAKSDQECKTSMQIVDQVAKLFVEIEEKDHKITKSSVCFYQEILNNSILASLNNEAKTNINQFLYMINANYYDEITRAHETLTREALITRVIEQIGIYVSNNNVASFGPKEVEGVISMCFFIENEIKKQIINEFKKSLIKCGECVNYHIYDKNIDTSKPIDERIKAIEAERDSLEHQLKLFDASDIKWYEFLLKTFTKVPADLKEYGEVTSVEWDLFALRDIMSFMLSNFHQELLSIKGDFYNSKVVIDYMYNAFVYTKVNNKTKVGLEEMINTFKNWSFFEDNLDLKLKIMDAIFNEFRIDYKLHPFKKHARKEKSNIREFKKRKNRM